MNYVGSIFLFLFENAKRPNTYQTNIKVIPSVLATESEKLIVRNEEICKKSW